MADESSAVRAELERWRRRAEMWRSAATMLNLATWQHDLVADVGEWSEEARALCGIDEGDESSPSSFLRAVHPDDRDELAALLRGALESQTDMTVTCRHRITRGEGEVRWLETRLRAECDGAGRPVRLVCVSIDRTDTVRRDEARRAELSSSASFDELSSDAVFVSVQGRFVDVNDSACDLLGYAREELLAKTILDLLDPVETRADPPSVDVDVGKSLRRGRRLRHKNGRFVYVELTIQKFADGRIHAIARDVTRRVAAENALQESEATLRELGANLPGLLWVREVGTERVLYANDGWTSVLGKRPVIGGHYWQLVEPVHKEDLPRLVVDPPECTDQERDQVVRFVLPDGSIQWYRVCKFGIRDVNGQPHRVAGFAMNVTQERVAEERIRASLREKETLLREIHHRVKNNLQVISSLLNLQAASSDAPGLAALLRQSQSRVASMALVHDMLYHSSDLSQIPFGRYARSLGRTLAITYCESTDAVALQVDAGDLALTIDVAVSCGLLLNEIVSNSFKHAFPPGTRGTIRVALHLDEAKRYHLRVSDDGVGLPEDFETRRKSSLGSKLIDTLVEQIGGTMTRTSSERGTAYDIVFRADHDEARA